MSNHIIETERHGLWIAAAFIVALLGLVSSLVALNRVSQLAHVSQAEVLVLNKRIAALEKDAAPAAAPAAEAAPADAAPAPAN
jgi:type II secretory pathway component PulJ